MQKLQTDRKKKIYALYHIKYNKVRDVVQGIRTEIHWNMQKINDKKCKTSGKMCSILQEMLHIYQKSYSVSLTKYLLATYLSGIIYSPLMHSVSLSLSVALLLLWPSCYLKSCCFHSVTSALRRFRWCLLSVIYFTLLFSDLRPPVSLSV